MAKITLSDVANISGSETAAINTINGNSQIIESSFDNTLSRDGTSPNSMQADIDLNDHDLLNVGSIDVDSIILNGSTITSIDDFTTHLDGWSPKLVIASDSSRRVFQLIDWVGGDGTKPTDFINQYVTITGYSSNIADAVDVRGASGAGTGDMLAANNLADLTSAPAAFINIKQPATTASTGVVELATFAQAIAGTPSNLAVTSDVIKQIIDMVSPVGQVAPFVRSTAPTYWLALDGTSIGDASSGATGRANADTINLFTIVWNSTSNSDVIIQTNTGVGSTRGVDAATDFAAHKRLPLPNLQDYFIRGRSVSRGIANIQADAYGSHSHTGTTTSGGSHSHTVTADGEAYGSNGVLNTLNFMICGGDVNGTSVKPSQTTTTGGAHTHTFSTSSSGDTETRPKNVAMLYCVRY